MKRIPVSNIDMLVILLFATGNGDVPALPRDLLDMAASPLLSLDVD